MRLIFIFATLFSCLFANTAHAVLFDRPKDPASLILNQKDCTYMKTYRGKTVNGSLFVMIVGLDLNLVLVNLRLLPA